MLIILNSCIVSTAYIWCFNDTSFSKQITAPVNVENSWKLQTRRWRCLEKDYSRFIALICDI